VSARWSGGGLPPADLRVVTVQQVRALGLCRLGVPQPHSAYLVSDAVTALLRIGVQRWVIDVAGLTGCDHTGLRTIGATYRRALRHDRGVTLIGAPRPLLVALGRLRLDHHLLTPGDGIPATPARASAQPHRARDGRPLPPAGRRGSRVTCWT
jgi:anti-anti-sigma regulatory factor